MNIPENIIPLSEIEKEAKKLGIRIRNPRHDIFIKKRQAVVEPFDSDAYEEEYKRIYEKYENMLKNNDTIRDWSDLEIRVQDFSFEILDDDIELNETNNSESERQKIRENKPDSRPAPEYNLRSFDSLSADEQEELITLKIKRGIRFNQYLDLTRKFNDRAEFDYEYFEEEGSTGTRIRYSHEDLKRKPAPKGRNKRVTDGLSLSSGANDKFKKQLALIDEAVSKSSSRGINTSSYQQKDITKELVDEVEKATLDIQNTIRLITERIDEQLDEAYDGNLPEAQKQARIDELLEELESVSKVQESSRLAYQTLEKLQSIFDENRRNLDPSLNPWPPGLHISRNKDGEITGIALTAISNAPISGEYSKRWNNIGDVSDGRVLSIDYLVSLHKEEGTGRTMLGTILDEAKNNNVSLIQIEATNSSAEYWNKFGFSNPKRNNDWATNGALPSYSFLPIEVKKETDDK